jgi:hypothetical protein
MSEDLIAPWTDEQVELINLFQKSGKGHPYTCGGGGGPHSGVDLIATNEGWVCPECGRVVQLDVMKMCLTIWRLRTGIDFLDKQFEEDMGMKPLSYEELQETYGENCYIRGKK